MNESQKEGKAITQLTIMSQLSSDEILAVQEMRKRKVAQESGAATKGGLGLADRVDPREVAAVLHELAEMFRPILLKIEQAETEQRREVVKKQHATGPGSYGSYSMSF